MWVTRQSWVPQPRRLSQGSYRQTHALRRWAQQHDQEGRHHHRAYKWKHWSRSLDGGRSQRLQNDHHYAREDVSREIRRAKRSWCCCCSHANYLCFWPCLKSYWSCDWAYKDASERSLPRSIQKHRQSDGALLRNWRRNMETVWWQNRLRGPGRWNWWDSHGYKSLS